jgi:hypothetical protein
VRTLNHIRKRLAAATQGTWSREAYEDGEQGEGPHGVHPGSPGPMVESKNIVIYQEDGSLTQIADVEHEGDAAFLVNAPEDVRHLLAIISCHESPRVLEDVSAERARQVAKGRDAAHDDARSEGDWIQCVGSVVANRSAKGYDDRAMWVKIAAVAVAAIESIDRKAAGGAS